MGIIIMCVLCCCNETAAAEIYTYDTPFPTRRSSDHLVASGVTDVAGRVEGPGVGDDDDAVDKVADRVVPRRDDQRPVADPAFPRRLVADEAEIGRAHV